MTPTPLVKTFFLFYRERILLRLFFSFSEPEFGGINVVTIDKSLEENCRESKDEAALYSEIAYYELEITWTEIKFCIAKRELCRVYSVDYRAIDFLL